MAFQPMASQHFRSLVCRLRRFVSRKTKNQAKQIFSQKLFSLNLSVTPESKKRGFFVRFHEFDEFQFQNPKKLLTFLFALLSSMFVHKISNIFQSKSSFPFDLLNDFSKLLFIVHNSTQIFLSLSSLSSLLDCANSL